MDRTEYFICFRGDAEMGGAIGAELYRTLNDRQGKNTYFSSKRNRVYGTNYRKEEERAIDDCHTFIVVLTDYLIEGLKRENDEVLYELKTALCYPDKKIMAVAHKSFCWDESKKSTLDELLGKERAERIYFVDYITYEGARSYADFTEKIFLQALDLSLTANVIIERKELLEKLITFEVDKLKKAHASSTLFMKMDTIIKDYYVEPKLFLNGAPYFDNIQEVMVKKGDVTVIHGESGSGKSTLVQRMFMELATKAINGEMDNQIPIFKSLNGAKEIDFDYEKIVRETLEQASCAVDDKTLKAFIESTAPLYIYDALDEKSAELNSELIERAISNLPSNATLVLTMRSSYFKGFYTDKIILNVSNILEVKPFGEREIGKYSLNFLVKARGLGEDDAIRVVEKIKEHKIFSRILVLTYYLATSDFDEIDDGVIRVSGALEGIVRRIIKREREKKMMALTESEGELALKRLAWTLYSVKRKKLLTRNSLSSSIANELYLTERDVREIIDLFTIENENGTVIFVHEMFKEYLIARDFVDRIMDESRVDFMLDRTFNKEINAFIAEIFNEEGVDEVYDALENIYDEIDECDYVKVLAIFNHMHRLNRFKKVAKFVRKVLDGSNDVVMRILCLHSLLACGDETDEQKYYDEFIANEQFALLNCGMALRYYNDDRTDIEIPYYDDGELSWRKCFISYKAHLLNENKLKHYYRIRRINILSAKKFIEVRKEVDGEVAEFYRSVQGLLLRDDSPFGKLVYQAYLELMETIERYE